MAERGHLREAGNLVFPMSLVVLLIGVAIGGLYGFRGTSVVGTGRRRTRPASRRNVNSLDTRGLARVLLRPGTSYQLPDGKDSIETGVTRWVKLQMS